MTEHSKLRMIDGAEKSIKDIRVGDKLLAFDDKLFSLKESIVEEAEQFIPQELYQVELENGTKFMATPDHLIVVNGEWRSIQEMLHDPSAYDILEL